MYLVALIGSVMLICLVPSLNARLAEILIMLGKVPKVSGRDAIFSDGFWLFSQKSLSGLSVYYDAWKLNSLRVTGCYVLHDFLGVCVLHQEFPVKKLHFIALHEIECLKTHSILFFNLFLVNSLFKILAPHFCLLVLFSFFILEPCTLTPLPPPH